MSDDKKVIFSMQKLSKTYQGADKPVLKNIYLSFFYGAKIGILGLNGSGKSSLLKIIAGVDKNYQGDVVFQPGYTVGYLEQEPILDDSKTVIEIVREGAAETMAVLEEYNQINDLFGLEENYSDPDKMDKLMDRQDALFGIHIPETFAEKEMARRRLAFDELLRVQLVLVMRKRLIERDSIGIQHKVNGQLVARFYQHLPYELTQAQHRVIAENGNPAQGFCGIRQPA